MCDTLVSYKPTEWFAPSLLESVYVHAPQRIVLLGIAILKSVGWYYIMSIDYCDLLTTLKI